VIWRGADLAGPVFNRVWDTPDLDYAEKFKHTIEPFFGLQRTSLIENYDRVVAGVDAGIIGGVTSYSYGINSRLYAKRRLGQTSQAQQIASLAVGQTSTPTRARRCSIRATARVTGTRRAIFGNQINSPPARRQFSGNVAEVDLTQPELRTLQVGGRHIWSRGQRRLMEPAILIQGGAASTIPGQPVPQRHGDGTLQPALRRHGTLCTMPRSTVLQQSIQGYYNAVQWLQFPVLHTNVRTTGSRTTSSSFLHTGARQPPFDGAWRRPEVGSNCHVRSRARDRRRGLRRRPSRRPPGPGEHSGRGMVSARGGPADGGSLHHI
jgi:hypothetical protein